MISGRRGISPFSPTSVFVSLPLDLNYDIATYLSPPVEVGTGNVEAMDVRGNNCQDEEQAIECEVHPEPAENVDRRRRKEDVHDRENDSINEASHLEYRRSRAG